MTTKLTWKPAYVSRIHLPSPAPDRPGGVVELRPGVNEIDDETMEQLRRAPGFDRLVKAGALQVPGEREPNTRERLSRTPTEEQQKAGTPGANTPPPGGTLRDTTSTRARASAETVNTSVVKPPPKDWNPQMNKGELAQVLERRGIPSKGMTREDMVNALQGMETDAHSDQTSPDAGRR